MSAVPFPSFVFSAVFGAAPYSCGHAKTGAANASEMMIASVFIVQRVCAKAPRASTRKPSLRGNRFFERITAVAPATDCDSTPDRGVRYEPIFVWLSRRNA